MRKHHYFEFMDLKHYPSVLRDVMSDNLAFITLAAPIFDRVAPIIVDIMKKTNTNEILDLCSGGGGPWKNLFPLIQNEYSDVKLRFTDLYPNSKCMRQFPREWLGQISYVKKPVSALDVPIQYRGVRTFFGSFHHMSPKNAIKVLEDAAKKKTGILVAESFSHTPGYLWRNILLQLLISPLYFLMLWVLSFKSIKGTAKEKIIKVLFTLIIPIAPICMMFDTFISGVRVYMKEDLDEMIKQIHVPGYKWKTGVLNKKEGPSNIVFVIGIPE